MLSDREVQRYDRQIMIQGFGIEGQEKLKKSRVLIAGVGGLGSPAADLFSGGRDRVITPGRP